MIDEGLFPLTRAVTNRAYAAAARSRAAARLAVALRDEAPEAGIEGARALGRLCRESQLAAPRLEIGLRQPDRRVRREAARAMARAHLRPS